MVAEVAFASLDPPVMSRTGAVRRRRLGLPTEASGTIFPRAMTYTADRRVDAYIDSLPDWQQDICEVRALVHAADPEVTETIKRNKLPFFFLHGNVRVLLAAKDHVDVFLYDGAMVPDPDGIISSGQENKTARTVAVRRGEPINAEPLIAMFRAIIANNRAGGWRQLKAADLADEICPGRRTRPQLADVLSYRRWPSLLWMRLREGPASRTTTHGRPRLGERSACGHAAVHGGPCLPRAKRESRHYERDARGEYGAGVS